MSALDKQALKMEVQLHKAVDAALEGQSTAHSRTSAARPTLTESSALIPDVAKLNLPAETGAATATTMSMAGAEGVTDELAAAMSAQVCHSSIGLCLLVHRNAGHVPG
jgi:hypothetical protein